MSCLSRRHVYIIHICLISMGSMMVVDSPGALQHSTIHQYNLTAYQFSFLFSVSSWASCLDLVQGFVIDRYLGLKLASLIYIVVFTFGNIVYSVSGFTSIYDLMLSGRFIYGLGGNPILLCLNTYMIHWFGAGKELNLVFALQTSSFWLGSSIIYLISYKLEVYAAQFVTERLAFGIAVCTTLAIPTIIMFTSSLTLALAYKKPDSIKHNEQSPEKGKKAGCIDIIHFPLIFWILAFASFVYAIVVYNFLMTSEDFFVIRYNYSVDAASNLTGILGILLCVLSPLIGIMVDRCGRNLSFISSGVFLAIICHTILSFTTWNPIVPLILLAISATLLAMVFPLFNYLVKQHQVNTAYGIAQTGMNGSLAIGSLIAGYIIDVYGYEGVEKFYLFILFGTIPAWCLIWYLNYRRDNILNLSAFQRNQIIIYEKYVNILVENKTINNN